MCKYLYFKTTKLKIKLSKISYLLVMWWNIHRKFATNLAALYLFCMTYYATNIVMNQFKQVFKSNIK